MRLFKFLVLMLVIFTSQGCPKFKAGQENKGVQEKGVQEKEDDPVEARAVLAFRKKDVAVAARQNNTFAFDLYAQLGKSNENQNLFFSPYSISSALAMTFAGAKGNTRAQMAKALRFSLPGNRLHEAFYGIDSRLYEIRKAAHAKLAVANSLWPQKGYDFKDDYLALLKKYYGVSISYVDYIKHTEDARETINQWVEEKTNNKITELIEKGVLKPTSRLTLVNAIWFKGMWASPFKTSETMNRPYYLSASEKIEVVQMKQKHHFRFAMIPDLKLLEMPYAKNEFSMIILLPHEIDGLDKLESKLTRENLEKWLAQMHSDEITVYMPKFKMSAGFRLDDSLRSLGMTDAFDQRRADFSGMDPDGYLFIGAVIHKAFVDVNEQGTEASAASAVGMRYKGMATFNQEIMSVDHPFVFLIRENETGSILFLGRVIDPRKTQ